MFEDLDILTPFKSKMGVLKGVDEIVLRGIIGDESFGSL